MKRLGLDNKFTARAKASVVNADQQEEQFLLSNSTAKGQELYNRAILNAVKSLDKFHEMNEMQRDFVHALTRQLGALSSGQRVSVDLINDCLKKYRRIVKEIRVSRLRKYQPSNLCAKINELSKNVSKF